jgi:hypothetical protein
MRFKLYLLLFLLMPAALMAQTGMIKGKVMSADLQAPLSQASVFLSNATYGTATASDGTFILENVKPGQYELVVSYVGYDSYQTTVLVGSGTITLNIEMHLKSYGLNEVNVVSHKFSKENFAMFTKYFLGTTENAKQCKILNPKIVDLNYNRFDKTLTGYSNDFIIIENRALGYKLKYLLSEFKFDGINEIITVGGRPVYEDLKGSKSQLIRWHKAREEAYYGSSMHFFRALKDDDLYAQGFIIYRLYRRPNHNRPPQFQIIKKIDQFQATGPQDSLNYWINLHNLRRYQEDLLKPPLFRNDIFFKTDSAGIFGLTFQDNLYVVYTKKHDEKPNSEVYRPLDMENFAVTIVTLYTKYAFFDLNGIVMTNKSTLYEGDWADRKIPELLPVDYAPDDKKEIVK